METRTDEHGVGQFRHWLAQRDARYIAARSIRLVRRYGLSSRRATDRAYDCAVFLGQFGASPTFMTPGRVVRRNAAVCRRLEAMGAEIGVHGFDHIDFRSLTSAQARGQFDDAVEAFDEAGVAFAGFRCPYLSYGDRIAGSVPPGAFAYSSNSALVWDLPLPSRTMTSSVVYDTLGRFYRGASAATTPAVPRARGPLLELPVSLPDDLQLNDGLHVGPDDLRRTWCRLLQAVHRRDELFVLLFHPELLPECRIAFAGLLTEARRLAPRVWVTQLREVAAWWRERADARIDVVPNGGERSRLRVAAPRRVTVLARGLDQTARRPWHGGWDVLEERDLELAEGVRPMVGATDDVPEATVEFLRDQGWPIDTSERARTCSLVLDAAEVERLGNEVALLEHLEAAPGPLVRIGRWPDELRGALCISGDLDAVSLRDYAVRAL